MTMCSLTRHISNPNCHDDAVDDLDIVVDTEIGALVRVAISGDAWNPVARKAGNDLRAWGMFVDVMNGGADATHTLTTSRASNPNCHDDAVDDLDIVVDTEIGALVRVAISGDAWNPVARKAGNDLRAWGMFVDVMNGGADATHTLTTSRAVYALRVV